ncbi:hypothetical protein J6590_102171 [Homalodisca vitripennis]|nr:hypothetical protein J6590_102171 [Homalodisca vitripennis]
MSQVYTGMNEGKVCAGLFVDVMKAFDTVDHRYIDESSDSACSAPTSNSQTETRFLYADSGICRSLMFCGIFLSRKFAM